MQPAISLFLHPDGRVTIKSEIEDRDTAIRVLLSAATAIVVDRQKNPLDIQRSGSPLVLGDPR